MDKFFKWMKEKGYNLHINSTGFLGDGIFESIPKQMLIGYMMEYLDSKNIEIKLGTDMLCSYIVLKEKIKEIE